MFPVSHPLNTNKNIINPIFSNHPKPQHLLGLRDFPSKGLDAYYMIELNPQYEAIFNPHNIDDDCDKIAQEISTVGDQIAEVLKVGMYKQTVTMYLQLLKSMANHFVEDEHYCFFDDLYSPEYALERIYKEIKSYNIDEESQILLDIGHSEIMDSECYQEYGYPSYL